MGTISARKSRPRGRMCCNAKTAYRPQHSWVRRPRLGQGFCWRFDPRLATLKRSRRPTWRSLMRHLWFSAFAALLLLSRVPADGLIYRLPEDGSFARFDMEATKGAAGKAEKVQGALLLSSVGRKDVAGKPCRWIEFKIIGQLGKEDTSIIKVLIPEDKLREGEDALGH